MRAADTNILLRYIAKDDLKQFAEVERLFDACAKRQEQVFVPVPVLCELVWSLTSGYRQSKQEVVSVLEFLLNDGLFHLDQGPLIRIALGHYRQGKAGFADYLIGAIARDAGCRDTVTFDRDLRGAGFTVLP